MKTLLSCLIAVLFCAMPAKAQTAPPSLPASTTFTSSITVPVTDATSGASKFCTVTPGTSGTTPQVGISPLYTSSFSFTATTTVECIAATSATFSNSNQTTTVGGSAIPRWQVADTAANDDPGGTGVPQTTTQTFNVASPSMDSNSMFLSQKSSAGTDYTNVLWPFLAFPADSATTFVSDFWVYPINTANAVAFEFDDGDFDHSALTNVMMGHQFCFSSCGGIPGWNTWNQASGSGHGWQGTGLTTPLNDSAWNHIIFIDYIVPGDTSCAGGYPHLHFYSITQNGVVNVLNQSFCAGALNSTWSGHVFQQFQIDIKNTNTTVSEYVDEANITAYYPGSAITTRTYTLTSTPTAAAPTITPSASIVQFGTTAYTLSSTTPSSTILYCTGVSCTPTLTYSLGITATSSETVCAETTASGYTTSAPVCFAITIDVPTSTTRGDIDFTQIKVAERLGPGGLFQMTTKGAFSSIGTCNSTNEGATASVSDSTVAASSPGTTITGGGTNHVHAYCNGTNWIVN